MSDHDVIVIGASGGVGSAAMWSAVSRGARVLGLDRFAPGHARGSSHGDTRVIRMAYFEHPDYVPLLRRAYELWGDLEQAVGRDLFMRVGALEIGPEDGEVVPGVLRAAEEHGLAVDALEAADVHKRFPGFEVPPGMVGVFEPDGGFLLVEQCVTAWAERAIDRGADLRIGQEVDGWLRRDGRYVVFVDGQEHRAMGLVIAPGAWAPDLLGALAPALNVRRKVLLWYGADDRYAMDRGAPVFLYELPEGVFYGFPSFGPLGLKVAEHTGGDPVIDPLELDRDLHAADTTEVERFLRLLPGVDGADRRGHAVCMYTMSPDAHFVVGGEDRLGFTCGLSGHGFKMTSVLGEIMADLALDNGTRHPIDFLSPTR